MTTATVTPERDARGIFLETPPEVAEAIRNLLSAHYANLDAGPLWSERKRLGEARRIAQAEAERVILQHQGGASFLSGLYRVDRHLVGMRKLGPGGLRLVIYPTRKGAIR